MAHDTSHYLSVGKAKLIHDNLKSEITPLVNAIHEGNLTLKNKAIYLANGESFTADADSTTRVASDPYYVPDGYTAYVHATGIGRFAWNASTNGTTVTSYKGLTNASVFQQCFVGPIYFRVAFAHTTNTAIDPIDVNVSVTINPAQQIARQVTDAISTLKPLGAITDVGVQIPEETPTSGSLVTASGFVTSVFEVRKGVTYTVTRRNSASTMILMANRIYRGTASNLAGLRVDSSTVDWTNTNGYKYLYVVTKMTSSPNYEATVYVKDVSDIPKYNDEIKIDENVVCTYKDMYVSNNAGVLYFSSDNMKTWSKSINAASLGIINSYHIFANGGMAVFTNTKAYYTDDWSSWHEAAVYEADGTTPYTPATYDNFTQTKEWSDRKTVNGQDLYVFGNYTTSDASNPRILIWASSDNGHSYRVIYEFNITGALDCRHIHTVLYNPNFDVFLCATGDSAAQSHVIEFAYYNGSFTGFTSLGDGLSYKWASIVPWGEYIYYCVDETPGAVKCCKYSDIGDISKHSIVLDNLPSDAIGLFIGQRGDMLVTLSNYRTGNTHSPFSAAVDAYNLYYSTDRINFECIRGEKPRTTDGIFYGFYGVNADGRVVTGFFESGQSVTYWSRIPSVDLAVFIKNAGHPNAFMPYDPSCEAVPVLQIECADVEIDVDETKALSVSVYPYNASVKTWSIIEYDPTYISVSNGNITGVAPGETTIKIRSNSNYNVQKTVNVTVS